MRQNNSNNNSQQNKRRDGFEAEYDQLWLRAKGLCEVCTVEPPSMIVKKAKEETAWAEGMCACVDCYNQVKA